MRGHEWARSAEDALNRRSKLYLKLSREQQEKVAQWFAQDDEAAPATARAQMA